MIYIEMMARMQGEMRKHFCHEEELTETDHFDFNHFDSITSEKTGLSEEAGLSFEQNTPSHLRGLKDYELEFLLTRRRPVRK